MRFIRQDKQINIKNLDKLSAFASEAPDYGDKNGTLLPSSIRAIICGPSNCGKTNCLFSLIENEHLLRFENIYVASNSLHQSKFCYLRKLLSEVDEVGYFEFGDGNIVPIGDVRNNSLIIFDDVHLDKQKDIRSFYAFGRHKNIDVFLLSQTYSIISKQLVRDNANLLILFPQDETNLLHIFKDHISGEMDFNKFKELCHECWKEKYGFVVIDKYNNKSGKFRLGFDTFIEI